MNRNVINSDDEARAQHLVVRNGVVKSVTFKDVLNIQLLIEIINEHFWFFFHLVFEVLDQ